MSKTTASQLVRGELVETLRLDLVGPSNDHAFAQELLPEPPTRWYLTGFLVPSDAPADQRTDETATDEIDAAGDTDGTDDADAPDRAPAQIRYLPSSMGLSVLVDPGIATLEATVSWGDYVYEAGEQSAEEAGTDSSEDKIDSRQGEAASDGQDGDKMKKPPGYRRVPRSETVSLELPATMTPVEFRVPSADGLVLVATVRSVSAAAVGARRLPSGARSVSVFLVNRRRPKAKREAAYRAFAFQAELKLSSPLPFIARPDLRSELASESGDWDEAVADLQYRDVFEYAVGHGVSASAHRAEDGSCAVVNTTWIPMAEVEWVAPADIPEVELGMEALGSLASGPDATLKLTPLVTQYRAWIEGQRTKSEALDGERKKTARELMDLADYAAKRIEAGIALLAQEDVLEAFRIANRAMARAARQRDAGQRQTDPASGDAPR